MAVRATNRFPAIIAALPRNAGRVVDKALLDIEAHATLHAAVDTGNMLGSINAHKTGPLSGEVEAAAYYSIYVELGTRRMAAQPFMVPAAEVVRPAFIAAMGQLV